MGKIIARIIIVVLIILAVTVCYLFFIRPVINKNIDLVNKISTERQKYNDLNGRIDTYLEIRNDYDTINARYQKFTIEFPFDSDTTVIANEIYDLVDYSEVELESINFEEIKAEGEENIEKDSSIGIIEIDILITGTFYQSLTFINSFDVLPRTIRVREITMESNPEDYEDISTYIRAETYYDKNI